MVNMVHMVHEVHEVHMVNMVHMVHEVHMVHLLIFGFRIGWLIPSAALVRGGRVMYLGIPICIYVFGYSNMVQTKCNFKLVERRLPAIN
jgi:hypothetical protein